jgi:tetratricopeptide (TPR) repeat protein
VGEGSKAFRVLLTRNAGGDLCRRAGIFLLGLEQYRLAREFLEKASAQNPAVNLDLAIAVFFDGGSAEALQVLDREPESNQSGDYLLLKAKILDAAGRSEESAKVLEQGLRLPISRPQIGKETALLLVRHNRAAAAVDLLNRVAGMNPDLLLTKATILGLMNQTSAAEKGLKEIESQWPEWDRPYLVHGMLLERAQPREAIRKFKTAAALGMNDLALRCGLARLTAGGDVALECSCAAGLHELLFPRCGRP